MYTLESLDGDALGYIMGFLDAGSLNNFKRTCKELKEVGDLYDKINKKRLTEEGEIGTCWLCQENKRLYRTKFYCEKCTLSAYSKRDYVKQVKALWDKGKDMISSMKESEEKGMYMCSRKECDNILREMKPKKIIIERMDRVISMSPYHDDILQVETRLDRLDYATEIEDIEMIDESERKGGYIVYIDYGVYRKVIIDRVETIEEGEKLIERKCGEYERNEGKEERYRKRRIRTIMGGFEILEGECEARRVYDKGGKKSFEKHRDNISDKRLRRWENLIEGKHWGEDIPKGLEKLIKKRFEDYVTNRIEYADYKWRETGDKLYDELWKNMLALSNYYDSYECRVYTERKQ